MTLFLNDADVRVYHGDCRTVMEQFDYDTFDAIVTDPPYGLDFMGNDWDNPRMLGTAKGIKGGFQRYPKGEKRVGYNDCDPRKFEEWCYTWAEECERILKPGGHMLAFGGTRMYHRMTCAIEDAGFEIRDCIMWIYGSGFPKSLNVARAIDGTDGRAGDNSPNAGKWAGIAGDENRTYGDRHGAGKIDATPPPPPSADAAPWAGWGTALKPACEPIVVARKPLAGTVAGNVLKYGTGGLNIDGCRIPGDVPSCTQGVGRDDGTAIYGGGRSVRKEARIFEPNDAGRWPSNVMFDEAAAGHLEGNARFFYVSKPNAKERNDHGTANDHPTVKPLNLMQELCRLVTPPGGTILDPFAGSGTTLVAARREGFHAIGIEMTDAYLPIIAGRLSQQSLFA